MAARDAPGGPGATKVALCLAEGCEVDTLQLGGYSAKRRLCPAHLKASVLQRKGAGSQLWRFCQQCGKLEPLEAFDGDKRSCRVRLAKRRLGAAPRASGPGGDGGSSSMQPPSPVPEAGDSAPGGDGGSSSMQPPSPGDLDAQELELQRVLLAHEQAIVQRKMQLLALQQQRARQLQQGTAAAEQQQQQQQEMLLQQQMQQLVQQQTQLQTHQEQQQAQPFGLLQHQELLPMLQQHAALLQVQQQQQQLVASGWPNASAMQPWMTLLGLGGQAATLGGEAAGLPAHHQQQEAGAASSAGGGSAVEAGAHQQAVDSGAAAAQQEHVRPGTPPGAAAAPHAADAMERLISQVLPHSSEGLADLLRDAQAQSQQQQQQAGGAPPASNGVGAAGASSQLLASLNGDSFIALLRQRLPASANLSMSLDGLSSMGDLASMLDIALAEAQPERQDSGEPQAAGADEPALLMLPVFGMPLQPSGGSGAAAPEQETEEAVGMAMSYEAMLPAAGTGGARPSDNNGSWW